jgi:hypothetical protein
VQEKPTLQLVTASRNPLLLEGLRSLSALGNFLVVAEGADADQTLRLVMAHQPGVLLVEDELVVHCETLVADCRRACPRLKVVLLEGPVDFVYSLPASTEPDALVRRTSSMATLARTLEALH